MLIELLFRICRLAFGQTRACRTRGQSSDEEEHDVAEVNNRLAAQRCISNVFCSSHAVLNTRNQRTCKIW